MIYSKHRFQNPMQSMDTDYPLLCNGAVIIIGPNAKQHVHNFDYQTIIRLSDRPAINLENCDRFHTLIYIPEKTPF